MPQRIQSIHVPTPDVQGEDSWLKLAPMTVQQFNRNARIAELANKGNPEGADLETESRELYAEIVLDWNWVDNDGTPLPKPFNNPAVFDQLTMLELNCIGTSALQTITPAKKNGTK